MPNYDPFSEMLDHPPQSLDTDAIAGLPAALASRPWHPRQGVPVPVMNVHTDDDHVEPYVDFLSIDPQVAVRCGMERLCGICGTALPERIAFLGTVGSIIQHLVSDPPFHEHCARAALRWCPHLRLHNHQRAPLHRHHPDTPPADWWDDTTRPDRWALGITTDYSITTMANLVLFRPLPYLHTSMLTYTGPNNSLVESTIEFPDPPQ